MRRETRAADDGYASALVPGLRSSIEAERLAGELAFAQRRLELLGEHPPGPYAEVAGGFDGDLEERTWLAFLIALVGPGDGEGPAEALAIATQTSFGGGERPDFEGVAGGPRSALAANGAQRTVDAYRTWAMRSGSQAAAFAGEASWSPERRFSRIYERLALPAFPRDARYELLVTLGRTKVYDLRGGSIMPGGENTVTLAAKRALGIGDPLLLDRRAAELSEACGVDLEALDVALFNWERGERCRFGFGPEVEAQADTLQRVRGAMGLL